ncbi:MAG: biotin transporter BioY [Acidobacteria bacterium]|nr:biotin transporter BioY [Acidobacteriota bacterium]
MTSRASSAVHASTLVERMTSSSPAAGVRMLAVLFVTVLTAALAQVSFPLPFTPVPFTLQPMVVLLGGAALGARLGATSQILYLMLGIAGLPVFAHAPELPQGVLRLMGPSGGYLMAYPLAALVTGWLAERGMDRRVWTAVLAMAAGLAAVYAGGVLWLAKDLGLVAAVALGASPFMLVDVIKIAAAAPVLPVAWRMLRS